MEIWKFKYGLILFAMFLFHILDDFVFQQILVSLKQKEWWKKNYPEKMYKNDYKIGLFTHSLEWTIMVFIPLILFLLYGDFPKQKFINGISSGSTDILLYFLFICNIIIHYFVDDMTANKKILNLIEDQIAHYIQIALTWIFAYFMI